MTSVPRREDDSGDYSDCQELDHNNSTNDGGHPESDYDSQGSDSDHSDQDPESQETERRVDDDEDRSNPQYIPKRGTFYEHDDRTAASGEESANTTSETPSEKKEGSEPATERRRPPRKSEVIDRWSHDKYNENEQVPKSRDELVSIYGYDIRNEDAPPHARRNRRYGRGPNKYTRTWEDEEAYRRQTAAQAPRKPPNPEDFPELEAPNRHREGRRNRGPRPRSKSQPTSNESLENGSNLRRNASIKTKKTEKPQTKPAPKVNALKNNKEKLPAIENLTITTTVTNNNQGQPQRKVNAAVAQQRPVPTEQGKKKPPAPAQAGAPPVNKSPAPPAAPQKAPPAAHAPQQAPPQPGTEAKGGSKRYSSLRQRPLADGYSPQQPPPNAQQTQPAPQTQQQTQQHRYHAGNDRPANTSAKGGSKRHSGLQQRLLAARDTPQQLQQQTQPHRYQAGNDPAANVSAGGGSKWHSSLQQRLLAAKDTPQQLQQQTQQHRYQAGNDPAANVSAGGGSKRYSSLRQKPLVASCDSQPTQQPTQQQTQPAPEQTQQRTRRHTQQHTSQNAQQHPQRMQQRMQQHRYHAEYAGNAPQTNQHQGSPGPQMHPQQLMHQVHRTANQPAHGPSPPHQNLPQSQHSQQVRLGILEQQQMVQHQHHPIHNLPPQPHTMAAAPIQPSQGYAPPAMMPAQYMQQSGNNAVYAGAAMYAQPPPAPYPHQLYQHHNYVAQATQAGGVTYYSPVEQDAPAPPRQPRRPTAAIPIVRPDRPANTTEKDNIDRIVENMFVRKPWPATQHGFDGAKEKTDRNSQETHSKEASQPNSLTSSSISTDSKPSEKDRDNTETEVKEEEKKPEPKEVESVSNQESISTDA